MDLHAETTPEGLGGLGLHRQRKEGWVGLVWPVCVCACAHEGDLSRERRRGGLVKRGVVFSLALDVCQKPSARPDKEETAAGGEMFIGKGDCFVVTGIETVFGGGRGEADV